MALTSAPAIDGTVSRPKPAPPSLTQISTAASAPRPTSTPNVPVAASAPASFPSGVKAPVEDDSDMVRQFELDLDQLTEQQIEAALAEIEARFGLTRAELEQEQGAAGRAFRLLETQLGRQRDQALEGAENNALQRGIFNSGIYGQDVAEIQRGYAEGIATGEANRQAKMSAIESALAGLEAQMTAEQAARAAQIRQEQLQFATSTYGTNP